MSAAQDWRPYDRTDAAWAGIDFTYSWLGLDLPPVAEVRRALAWIIEADPMLGATVDLARARWRAAADPVARAEELVSAYLPPDLTPDTVVDHFEHPLTGTGDPYRIHTAGENLVIRWSHAYGDAWSCNTFVKHLIAQARTTERLELPWTTLEPRVRDRLTLTNLVRRPGAVLEALRHRERYSGGEYERASLHTSMHQIDTVMATSRPGFLEDLAAQRKARGLTTSSGAVILTGIRHHLRRRGHEPVPGAEMLYDTRGGSELSARAFGNWACGVYITPEDDYDVESVGAALKQVRDDGLPFVAAAAARRRHRVQGAGDRMVMAPLGAPRLTLTHMNRGGPQIGFPWLPGRTPHVMSCCVANGVEAILIGGREMEGGRLGFSVTYYPAAWPRELVQGVVEDFLADPWGDVLAPGEVAQPRRTETGA